MRPRESAIRRVGWLPAPYRGLPRAMYALFAANAVQGLGNFVWPMLALLLANRLGLPPAKVGFFVTLTLIGTAIGALIGGRLSDHLGPRKVFTWSRTFTALTATAGVWLVTRADSAPLLPWMLALMSLLRGAAEPAAMALAAELSPRNQRQAAFSLLYLANRVGFAAPLIAGYLFRRHLAWLFLGYAVTGLVSALLVRMLVTDHFPASPAARATGASASEQSVWSLLWRQPVLLLLAMLLALYSLAHVQHLFGLPLQLKAWYGARGAELYGALMSLNALTAVLLTVPWTAIASRLSASANLALGGLLYGVGFGMLIRDYGLPWLVVSTLTWSLGEILVASNSLVFALDRTPPTHRGRVSSVLPLLSQGGYAIGPWVAGGLVARLGVSSIWPAALLISLLASVAVFSLRWAAER